MIKARADIPALWNDYCLKHQGNIQAAQDGEPGYYLVDVSELMYEQPDLVEALTNRFQETHTSALEQIVEHLAPDQSKTMDIRYTNLPHEFRRRVRDFTAEDIGHLQSYDDVLVTSVSDTTRKIKVGVFSCKDCGLRILVEQDEFAFTEPMMCPTENGGCGKRAPTFHCLLLPSESYWDDGQDIEVQDPLDMIDSGAPGKAIVVLEGKALCNSVQPGERIRVIGEHRIKQKRHGNAKSVNFISYIKANHVEKTEEEDCSEITDADRAVFDEIVKMGPEACLIGSIAPNVQGEDKVKLALGLQLFCSPPGDERKDFHVLLAGDPGTAKSAMAMSIQAMHPRSIFTTAEGSTDVGLTAALVPSPFGDDRKTLEAGAFVLADRGHIIVDELDKLKEKSYGSFYEALEQQTTTISKAGAKVTLHTRCPVLAICNPKSGRFDDRKLLSAQIGLPAPIFSRFGLKFMIKDFVKEQRDRQISDKVVDAHWNRGNVLPLYPPSIWKKYSKYSKTLRLRVDAKALKGIIADEYVKMRKEAQRQRDSCIDAPMPSARQLGDILRITEAIARLNLDTEIKIGYVNKAIELMNNSLKEGDDETYAGVRYSDMSSIPLMKQLIIDNADEMGAANEQMVIDKARELHVNDPEGILDKLTKEGTTYRPRYNFIKVIK